MVKKTSHSRSEEIATEIFHNALSAVNPASITGSYAKQAGDYFSEKGFKNFFIVGFGKASCQMAESVVNSIETDIITGGVVVTKYGHAEGQLSGARDQVGIKSTRGPGMQKIKMYEAGHPIPDDNGLLAANEIIDLLRKCDERALVLCLISGGGSALLASPYKGVSLGEKQLITDLLLRAGADITELNAVRKHISGVKGGRLAEIAYPAEIISLLISDVIGDKLDVIASGPTSPDTSTFNDAVQVIEKFNLRDETPENIWEILEKGRNGQIPETPKEQNPVFRNVQNIIIGSNKIALEAAKAKSYELGIEAEIISDKLTGEARDVGKLLAKKAKENLGSGSLPQKTKRCLISGGETTVTVRGNGKGGRNTELALSFAMEVEGTSGITLISAGTDGTDGPTDAAGAIVDGDTIKRARDKGLDANDYLDNNDSYSFFKQIDSLLITGPTGTNVMDIQIILID